MPDKCVAEISVKEHPDFDDFVATIEALRARDGCPWDREQTHASIANNMIEEAYEAIDAIEANDISHMREEFGDVLLQVVLQSQIADDAGEFSLDDVCREVNKKIIRRHPHVFGEVQVEGANEVLGLWDQIKLTEKNDSLLDDVPSSFPALMQAQKISRKAASAGFDWDNIEGIWDKVDEEIAELKSAYRAVAKDDAGKVIKSDDEQATEEVEQELGDVLFAFVNIARRVGLNAETALRGGCEKFRNRWSYIERAATAQGCSVQDLKTDELEKLWCEAKEYDAPVGAKTEG